jgi:uncharacterized sulfatase
MNKRCFLFFIALSMAFAGCWRNTNPSSSPPPNFLFVITDDQSWEHVGAYGDPAIRTPAMDQLARMGIKFEHAYAACPSCSPSRAGILTGQDIYRLEEAGVLTGFIREKYVLFPKILEENGYRVGSTGKRYWPRTQNREGAVDEPMGQVYQVLREEGIPEGISRVDYSGSFRRFLDDRMDDAPFFFWVGTGEPHRPYALDRGLRSGVDTSLIRVPAFLPDVPVTRLDLADYFSEIEWVDEALGEMMEELDQRGLLENTLIIFTSDNGMPFPRAKATLYDHGVRMPLIMAWKGTMSGNRSITTPVSLIDVGPTLLDLAGIEIPGQMTGRSRKDLLLSNGAGEKEGSDFVVTAFEKHCLCRADLMGFPRRAIHTAHWTYIVNYEPDRDPMGTLDLYIPDWDNLGEVDPSRTKEYFKEHRDDPSFQKLWELGFGKVPREELYDKNKDQDMVRNLAGMEAYDSIRVELKEKLETYLQNTGDPRSWGLSPWDGYNLDTPPLEK